MADATSFKKDLASLKRFWPYARPYRVMVTSAVISVPMVSIIGLLPPFLLMHGIDVNLQQHPPHQLLQSGLTALNWTAPLQVGYEGLKATSLLFFFSILLDYVGRSVQNYTLQYAGSKAVGLLRRSLYAHITNQSAGFFDRNPTGGLLTRTTNDIEALGESLSTGVVSILGDIFNLLAISLFMLFLSPSLTLVTFAISPILVLTVNFFRRRLKQSYLDIRRTLSDVNSFMQEHLSGVRIVQLMGKNVRTYEQFKAANIKYLRATHSSNIYDAALYAIMEGMASLCIALLLWYGGLKTVEGVLTIGLLAAFIEYTQRVFVPIKEFSGKFAVLQQAVAAIERVGELLDTHQEITPGQKALSNATGAIQFEDVYFRYTEKGGDVLKGISFEVKPQQVVALVGSTGSGKTTVGKVLTRLYDGYRGHVRMDGHELTTLTPDSVRAQVGVVQQDVVLFNGTIEFNISLGNPSISRQKVQEAVRLVQAEKFVESLPGGLDFVVAERGANLSAGQAQLLAFARVMAHDPPIVLLDEATAAIDTQTEAAIQAATEELLRRKTCLVIAHRLTTIQAADTILVMQLGEIKEQGNHATLMAHGGLYAELYHTGFGDKKAAE